MAANGVPGGVWGDGADAERAAVSQDAGLVSQQDWIGDLLSGFARRRIENYFKFTMIWFTMYFALPRMRSSV